VPSKFLNDVQYLPCQISVYMWLLSGASCISYLILNIWYGCTVW